MTVLPAPLLRGLTVIAIGGVLAVSHIAFASAAPAKATQVAAAASLATKSDVSTTGSIGSREELGENCYVELVREKTHTGKIVIQRIQECD